MHTVHLQVCDHDEAPDTTHHHENSTTRRLCALTADLNLVPSRFWINHSNSRGVKYQKLLYVMGMRIESGGLHFDLRVGNVTYGEVVASFD